MIIISTDFNWLETLGKYHGIGKQFNEITGQVKKRLLACQIHDMSFPSFKTRSLFKINTQCLWRGVKTQQPLYV